VPKLLSGTVAPAFGAARGIGEHSVSAFGTAHEANFREFLRTRCAAPPMRRDGILGAIPGGADETGALSALERRVTAGAARGASNWAIGEYLDVGARAVEHRLARVYRRLSILGRRQLIVALREHPGAACRGRCPAGLARGHGERSCDESSC
jgi:DNA-binding CsgD family transcriptional regulator